MRNATEFQPNWASSPGNTITDFINEKRITLSEFANQLSQNTAYVSRLLDGKEKITDELAKKLESIIGASASFWKKRELQYRAQLKHLKNLEEEWVKELPIEDMQKFGWIKNTNNILTTCLQFFDVPNIKIWRQRYSEIIQESAFRTSNAYKSKLGSVAAWLRQSELKAISIECGNWNKELFEKTLYEIRPLTRKKDPKDFIPDLITVCAKCGVAVVIVRTPSGCSASGVTKFITPNRAILSLSFRYLSDDIFWFTFFHEAGHLLLHSPNSTFIEDINIERTITEEEKEANIFSAEILVPSALQAKLKSLHGKRAIISFAQEVGVSPGIIVGQMQYYGFVDRKYLNGYKRRYTWEGISSLF